MPFDDQIRKALERAVADVRTHIEADLRTFVQELARAAAEERARAVKDAVEAAAADVRRQAHAQLAHLREATEKHTDELRRSAEAQTDELKRALGEARRTAEQQLAEASRHALEALNEARRAGDTALRELQQATARRVAELEEVIASVRRSAAAEADELRARLVAAAAEHERTTAAAIERARTDSDQAALAQAAQLADAVRALDEARSLGDVLDALADAAGREVERAAVLVVRGDRLSGRRLVGFDASAPPARSIDLHLDEAGLAGAVVSTGAAVSRPPLEAGNGQERQHALPPFAQDARARRALALPVTVGGIVVAVVYADAPALDVPSAASRWPAVLDVLARHASRVLEAMTVQQAVGLSLPPPVARDSHGLVPGPVQANGGDERGAGEDAARRYARLLLSEIRMYHQPLVDAGRRSRNLLARLEPEIARARRLYEARVPSSVTARSEYFEQELVQTLADGDRTLLGGSV